ncbi:MAG: hypothetical protein WCI91_02675 [Candidatus Nomurabacteria bacterium]
MIYILLGEDSKNKNLYIKEITKGGEILSIAGNDLNRELIMSYASNINLFSETPSVLIDNILSKEEIVFSNEDFEFLKESKTIFLFKEDKMLALQQKKYNKYADIKIFENKKSTPVLKFNIFSITDAFSNRDKITTWILYRNGLNSSLEPEAIAGVLFWKIKTMILNGSKIFSKEELKKQSSQIISIYHKAHRGELDFSVSLEQFILSSLSSK